MAIGLEDSGILSKAFDWMWAVVLALTTLVWKNNAEKINRINEDLLRQRADMDKIIERLDRNRDVFSEMFTRLSERTDDRFHEALTALHAEGISIKAMKSESNRRLLEQIDQRLNEKAPR